MQRRIGILIVVLLASLAVALPVLADAPAEGSVYEGAGVPGVELGDTRAEVEVAYGSPSFCQSVNVGGDNGSCSFPVNEGGQVTIRYRGADGGNAGNAPDDVATVIRWSEAAGGWVTTAGVNTTLAKADPDAVIAAYPNAQLTYNGFGILYSAVDSELGIEIIWAPDFYTGQTHVSMAIFAPYAPAPEPTPATHVESIDLTATRGRGQREITGLVRVQNERDLAAAGATVLATWTFPDGSVQSAQALTSSSGYAFFQLTGQLDRGTYALTIDDVLLADHLFDDAASVLSASVYAR